MKSKLIYLFLVLFFGMVSHAQIPKFAAEVNYPIPTGDNFLNENYKGIIDVGAQFRFINARVINIGLSVNGGLYTSDFDNATLDNAFDVNTYVIQPRVFAELNIKPLTKLHPSVGVGYTFVSFDVEQNNSSVFDIAGDTRSGLNINLGLAYDIIVGLHVKIQYDFIALSSEDGVPDTSFNNNRNILKLGVGFRL